VVDNITIRFYYLNDEERQKLKDEISDAVLRSVRQNVPAGALPYFASDDTYIRKAAYQAVGKLYFGQAGLRGQIMDWLGALVGHENENVRQAVVYAAGEIAAKDFAAVETILEKGLCDPHHAVRNAVTGSLKNAGNKNPAALAFCERHLDSPDPEIRRLVLHGLELRGRAHPREVIGLLRKLQFDKSKRVWDMLIHVLGQISYKKGCFMFVAKALESWENQDVYPAFAKEAVEVHGRYEKFSELTQAQVIGYFKERGGITGE